MGIILGGRYVDLGEYLPEGFLWETVESFLEGQQVAVGVRLAVKKSGAKQK